MATGVLVLADGTVLEARLRRRGEAVGEVCFNTAMTGYQEILTDPSYRRRSSPSPSPHRQRRHQWRGHRNRRIWRRRRARAGVVCSAITKPSNCRADARPRSLAEARGIIGLAGIDTRALTAPIRDKGMPQWGDRPRSRRQVRPRRPDRRRPRAWPGLTAWTSRRGHLPAALQLAREAVGLARRLWPARPTPRFEVVVIDYGVKRNILRLLAGIGGAVTVVPATTTRRGDPGAQAGRRVPLQRPRRSGGDRRLRRAGDPRAGRYRHAGLRHLPRPPDAGAGAGRRDREDGTRATTAPIIR